MTPCVSDSPTHQKKKRPALSEKVQCSVCCVCLFADFAALVPVVPYLPLSSPSGHDGAKAQFGACPKGAETVGRTSPGRPGVGSCGRVTQNAKNPCSGVLQATIGL